MQQKKYQAKKTEIFSVNLTNIQFKSLSVSVLNSF
jgi:hypothetical protein